MSVPASKQLVATQLRWTVLGYIEEQIGRKLGPKDSISIYEFKIVQEWQLERG